MFDSPPPSTMTSGSTMLITDASARAKPALVAIETAARARRRRAGARRDRRSPARPRRRARCSRARARDPRETSRCSRSGRSNTAGPGRSSSCGAGSGLWPHSPAMALAPTTTRPFTTRPPPVPVPMITPNTTAAPAAAPSVASDSAKQLASLASRTGRPSARARSLGKRMAVQPGGVGVLDQSGGRRDRAGDADADRGAVRLRR